MYINMAQEQQKDIWGRPRKRMLAPRFWAEGYIVKKAAPVSEMRCPHCDYVWTPRIENPKQCPRCKQYLERKPKKSKKV